MDTKSEGSDVGTPAVEWREINGFSGYWVSNTGLVRSHRGWAGRSKTPRILKPYVDKDGYHRVTLYQDTGKTKHRRVHALVAEAWHGSRDGCIVRHLDGTRINNTPDNLAWGSVRDNHDDAKRHGTVIKGTSINTNVLTEEQVKEIRSRYVRNVVGLNPLAREYGVTPQSIWGIVKGRSWKHLLKENELWQKPI